MKEIEGWSGYCITEGGDVISFKGKEPKVLNKIPDKDGYLIVNLCKDDRRQSKKIHRLVAEAFIPNPLGLPQVNHRDENKKNNCVENLEWCDHKYNINYGTRNEKVSKKQRNAPSKSKPVVAYIYESGEFYGDYPSAREAARQLGLNQSNITQCCKGKLKHTDEFVFVYKDTL